MQNPSCRASARAGVRCELQKEVCPRYVPRALGAVVEGVLAQNLPCVLVDDGSSNRCSSALNEIALASPQSITLLRHSINRGKGGAVLTGLRYAAEAGYTHAVQIDADGQHRAADIPQVGGPKRS